MSDSIFIKDTEVAQIAGRSVSNVRKWRRVGGFGPPFYQTGPRKNSIRYRREEVEAWAKANPNPGRGRRRKT